MSWDNTRCEFENDYGIEIGHEIDSEQNRVSVRLVV